MSPRIGVLGGRGAVGSLLAERLRDQGTGQVLTAGRAPAAVGGYTRVDLADDDQLAAFCARCDVVVNCAGPSRRILDRVAIAAWRAGARYVDVGGDDPVHARLTATGDRCAVLSAGMIPGLTGLLPRHLARHFDSADRLTVFHGVRDTIGPAAAYDFVAAVQDGDDTPSAAWRDGPRPGAALRLTGRRLPHFPEPVTAQPYLSPEAVRTATRLGLAEGTWHTVFDGERLPAVLQRIAGTARSATAELAGRLRQAAELDVSGRARYAILLFQLDGRIAGRPVTRSLVLRTDGAAALVAAVAAATVAAATEDRIPPGVHFAADVLSPEQVVARLAGDPAVGHLFEHDDALDDLVALDEGAI